MLLPLALATAALIVPSAQAAVEPGVTIGGNFFADPATYSQPQRLGAKWVRVFVFVDRLNPGVTAAYRSSFDRLHAQGIKVEVALTGGAHSPLRHDPDAYARAAADFVTAAGPGLHAVEIWNEQDAEKWWDGGPDPAAYAALLRAGHSAVKSVRPDVTVLVGGLTGNNSAFLTQLLAQGVNDAFDGVAVHATTACNLLSPYEYQKDNAGTLTFYSFLGYRELLKALASAGRPDAKVWFTEFGWSSSAQPCDQGVWAGQKAGGVSEEQQALFLRQAYHCLAADGANIGPSFWFDLKDGTADDTVDGRFGLLRHDGAQKPSYDAFLDVAHNGDSLTEPCGSFSGPTITVTELGDRKGSDKLTGRYRKQLRVVGTATDPEIVGRVTLYVNGKKIRNFTTQKGVTMPFAWNIDSAKRLPTGQHRLTVEAKDMKGNVTIQNFDVTKGDPAAKKKKRKKRR